MKTMWKKFSSLLKGCCVIATICTQWGDSGKGKLVDILAEWADLIVRGTGGGNAGHTVWIEAIKYVLHLIPCGIIRPGKINIIGNGVVVDPRALLEEIATLKTVGIDCTGRLFVAQNAKLVLPQHIALDRLRESAAGKGKIGTTGRGIGPAYEDHYRRVGLTMNDLLNPDVFRAKLEKNLREHNRLLATFDQKTVQEVMNDKILQQGWFYDPVENKFDAKAIAETYLTCGFQLAGMIRDTDTMVREALRAGKHILLEGAQGNMLSVDFGSYPYVTASDCTVQGLAKGAGLTAADVDLTVAIAKAFYMTRVGGGPFPTEMGGQKSADWCADKNTNPEREAERLKHPEPGDSEDFLFGIAIRKEGAEFGATTKRPRRTGWLDLPLLRYSLQHCGRNVALTLTKVDVLNHIPVIKLCVAYRYTGSDHCVGEMLLKTGCRLDTAIPSNEVMQHCEPIYEELPGWMCDISQMTKWSELPANFKAIVRAVEKVAGIRVKIVSVGQDREQIIFR